MTDTKQNPAQTLSQKLKGINPLFLVTVLIPTLLAVLYYGLIASDIYISESRFIIRSPQKQTVTGLGAFLQSAGLSRSQDDTYTVHDYILSRDALGKLNGQLGLDKSYRKGDFLSRFPQLDMDDSFEALHRFYQQQVSVQLDTLSSISTLRVRAFSAEEAYLVNQMLLDMSETLVNQLNERARQDMVRYAQAEVEDAEKKARAAARAVSQYRTDKVVFDPEKQSALQLQQVSRLQEQLVAAKSQLAQVRTLAPSNPQIPVLQKQVGILEAEIQKETAKVAGGERSLSKKAAEYERLALDRIFADKLLASALTSLEQARNDAHRKQLYLDRIVEPGKPDVAVEPRRIRSIITTIALGLIAWGVLSLLIAGIKEHHD